MRRLLSKGVTMIFIQLVMMISVLVMPPLAAICTAANYTIWPSTTTSAASAVTDNQPIEVGVKFRSDVSGYVTGLRFYKGSSNTGTHVGSLWTRAGTRLASATFTNETASGWQEVSFPTPVAITANTTYVASYYSPSGYFALDLAYFAIGADNPPLHALANGVDGGNGVYTYGVTGFPAQTFNSNNYWVDVVFSTVDPPSDTTPPVVTAFTVPSTSTSLTVPITSFTATDNVAVTGYLVNESTTKPLATASGWTTTAPTSYTFATSGSKTLYAWAKDAAGNVSDTRNATVTISINNQVLFSFWPAATVPGIVDSGPDSAVELGVKFRSDSSGSISGIRFYKASTNTGTHTGSLWTGSGTRLATATFSNETVSGWQQVNFAAPVAISANTVYVASYHTNSGHYSGDQYFFASTGVDSPPLHIPADGVSGVNGVYIYGAGGSFPNLGWQSSNYWVDVVFSATTQSDTTPPSVTAFTIPATSSTLTVPITSFTATDNVGATGYLVNELATKPLATASGWTTTVPSSYTFATTGSKTLYAWAKDAAGNVSDSRNATVTVTLSDTTPPVVTAFTVPSTSTSLTVPITSFTATDNVAVT
ncbi:MAG: DUF4082 domain-containing protein, partial [Proteobacteria bacterium]|nr:DUF4082 domain-containing protein [Pseudomonadota bacterium]